MGVHRLETMQQVSRDMDNQGYAVVEDLINSADIEVLRQECETLRELSLDNGYEKWGMDARSSCIYETVPSGNRTNRSSAAPDVCRSFDAYKRQRTTWPLRPENWNLLFNSHLTMLVQHVLGHGAVLFNDQYIVKPCYNPTSTSSAFSWHRDSDWCRHLEDVGYSPYISVWVALDDMTLDNGCLAIRPGSHNNTHNNDDSNRVGEDTVAEGGVNWVQLLVRAGTAVIMSDMVEHGSGPNTTKYSRRAWMPQFSKHPLVYKAENVPVSLAVPLC